jgi:hypothetical protein
MADAEEIESRGGRVGHITVPDHMTSRIAP